MIVETLPEVQALTEERKLVLAAELLEDVVPIVSEKRQMIDSVLKKRLDDECVAFPADWKEQVRSAADKRRSERLKNA